MGIFTLLFVVVAYLGGNIYVFYRLYQALSEFKWSLPILIVTFLIVTFSFLFSKMFGDSLPIAVNSILQKIGTSWMMIFIYVFLVFILRDIIFFINTKAQFLISSANSPSTRDSLISLAFVTVFLLLIFIAGNMKYRWKERVEVPISISKSLGEKKSLKIVAISDLHLGYTIGEDELDLWVKLINEENPDLVLIAGDIVDGDLPPVIDGTYAESFKKIKAPIYACLGNHEYLSNDLEAAKSFLEKSNIKLLQDSYVEIDSSLYIVGRDDRMNKNRKNLAELTAPLDKTKPIILLDHQPYHLEQSEEAGVDLQVSGHTHGGQIWPISWITKMMYEIDHGYLKKGNTHIYVSSGIGIWGGKFRLGSQSEYVVIEIK